MKVYKYRGIFENEKAELTTFERDTSSLENNYFWGADFSTLNDPCESISTSDKLTKQSKFILSFLGRKTAKNFEPVIEALGNAYTRAKKVGVFSLSQTYNDELLWAHYANAHKGYCIEYDLDILLKTYKSVNIYNFPVVYKKHPPSIDITDIIKAKDSIDIVKKMAGYKSLKWEYEEEIRLITDDVGEHTYDFQAVKSIYFGVRMEEDYKQKVMKRLKGRGIKYYQMVHLQNTYNFKRELVEDLYFNESNYLRQIEIPDSNLEPCKFEILEKNYWRFMEKAEIKIELERKISELELNWIAKKIKEDIFRKADKIYMFYFLKKETNQDFAWATSHFLNKEFEIKINIL